MINIGPYPYNGQQFEKRLQELKSAVVPDFNEQQMLRFILNSIDLTTLEGTDNKEVVEQLCRTAVSFKNDNKQIPSTGAVCVYPPFVSISKRALQGTGVKVASVAGAFPAGQSPIEIKLAEIRYALEQGADEIDMVISRGKFLEGNYQEVYDEIRAIREICGNATLKVILETGELKTNNNIYKAAQIAIAAGADFIKTSTGKVSVNATPEAFLVMMDAIKKHFYDTGKRVGVKVAGGVSDPETALLYVKLLVQVLGKDWMNHSCFRIGASRLANKVYDKIR